MRDESIGLGAVAVAGLCALPIGVWTLADAEIGASWTGAWRGLTSQLGMTGAAAVAMLTCSFANVLLGSLAMRSVRGRPFDSWPHAAVEGLAGAVVIDLVLLGVLGPMGLLERPVLIALHVAGLAFGLWWGSPLVAEDGAASAPRAYARAAAIAWWGFVAVAWAAPVIIMLASPVVAIQDVLPNHVAPVEYVTTYGSHDTLDIVPAPNYGPSRSILGYVALLGTLTELAGLDASLAASAFVLPLTLLLAAAAWHFASQVLGPPAARWVLITMPLTFSFVRLPDARGSVLAAPLALLALTPDPSVSARRRHVRTAVALGALLYVHPLLGAFALLTSAALMAWNERSPDGSAFAAAPMAGAVVFALPQLLTMAGARLPSWTLPIAVGVGLALVWLAADVAFPMLPVVGAAVVVLGALALWKVTTSFGQAATRSADLVRAYPLLSLGFVVFLLLPRVAGRERPVLVLGVGVALACAVGATFFPRDGAFWQGITDEVTGKTAQYWAPLFLATGSAGLLAALWSVERATIIARLAVGAIVVLLVLPVRDGETEFFDNEERRIAEQTSIALDRAERGAWVNWPDWRLVVDPSSRELLGVIRREQRAGRLGPQDAVLKVAFDHHSWASTPVAPFTGAIETSVSDNPDRSPHAIGGRLRHLSSLPRLLRGRYRYVLLEPEGLDGRVRSRILRAGFEPLFSNERGELLVRGSEFLASVTRRP